MHILKNKRVYILVNYILTPAPEETCNCNSAQSTADPVHKHRTISAFP